MVYRRVKSTGAVIVQCYECEMVWYSPEDVGVATEKAGLHWNECQTIGEAAIRHSCWQTYFDTTVRPEHYVNDLGSRPYE